MNRTLPCTYTFTPRFDESLDQTLAIISSYNVEKALLLLDRLENSIEVIRDHPEAYGTRDYSPPTIRRCSFKLSSRYPDSFALFYEFDEPRQHVTFHLVCPGDWNFSGFFQPFP